MTTVIDRQIIKVTRHNGIAGQIAYDVDVRYRYDSADNDFGSDSDLFKVSFIGSVYGGPVVMVSPGGAQTFVDDPAQYGEFSPRWIRRFYGIET